MKADLTLPPDGSIPEFLKISAEQRAAAWSGRRLTNAHFASTGDYEARIAREREVRAAIAEEKKQKSLAALERLKTVTHAGEHYDRKLKMWVPDNE